MTSEQAIKILKSKMDGNTDTSYEWTETVRMAIQVLEQKPCEDCISRQAVKELYYKDGYIDFRKICELQPVTPQQKIGHWVKIKPYPLQMYDYECSECGHETDDNTENYCSDCGAKMEDTIII